MTDATNLEPMSLDDFLDGLHGEIEAKDKRIAELEKTNEIGKETIRRLHDQQDRDFSEIERLNHFSQTIARQSDMIRNMAWFMLLALLGSYGLWAYSLYLAAGN